MDAPLQGLRVLDFSTLLPGPYASMMLADLGADVVHVESPTRVDLLRVLPPFDGQTSAAHAYLNRSKRSIALDLKKPGAADIVQRLLADFDILLEQFRPGVMQRLGLGYETLAEVHPELIYCALTGYGQTGPYANRAGHDINYLALSGISSYSGRRADGPSPPGYQLADVAGGSHHAVIGILSAVIQRNRTGKGQFIDVSMTDAVFSMHAMAGAAYLAAGEVPEREAGMLNGGAFYDFYPTRDGRYFSVGSLEPQFLSQLLGATGLEAFSGQAMSQEQADQSAVRNALREKFLERDFDEWCDVFAALDCCVEPELSLDQAVEHPQLKAREMVVEVPGEDGRVQRQIASPIRFSGGKAAYHYIGRPLGADTDSVLAEAGYNEEEIAEFRASGVFGKSRT